MHPIIPESSTVYHRRMRRGFTLIEMMIVIVVIAILVGLFFGGYQKWSTSNKKQLTSTRLEILNSMLAELEAQGHNTFQTQAFLTGQQDAFQYGNVSIDSAPNPPVANGQGTLTQPNDLMYIANNTASKAQVGYCNRWAAIKYMSKTVMAVLTALPNNASALGKLQADATALDALPANTTPTGPQVVLDAWYNPILFVPAGGLINVYVNTNSNNPQLITVTSPDGRPFFVSAGPDGDFVRGDDNIYSFEAK